MVEVDSEAIPGGVTITTSEEGTTSVVSLTIDATGEKFEVVRVRGAAGILETDDITVARV